MSRAIELRPILNRTAAPLIAQFGWQGVFVLGGIAPLLLVAILWQSIPESLRFSALGGWALGAGMAPAQIFVSLAVPMLACGLATLLLAGAFGARRVVEQPGVA